MPDEWKNKVDISDGIADVNCDALRVISDYILFLKTNLKINLEKELTK